MKMMVVAETPEGEYRVWGTRPAALEGESEWVEGNQVWVPKERRTVR